MNLKIFLCTPAFEGKVNIQYALSLSDTVLHLATKGIPVMIKITASGSLLPAERNRLTEAFLETDCTHMLCIDSDLGWPPQAVHELILKDMDFIAGCYPARVGKVFIFRPENNPDGSLVVDEKKKIIKMQYIPAGFMLIKRHVIEKMRSDNPDLYFEPKHPESTASKGYALFHLELRDGEFWGEDYHFCRIARKSGFEIWADPMIEFDHSGNRGCLAEILTNDREKSQNMEASKLD